MKLKRLIIPNNIRYLNYINRFLTVYNSNTTEYVFELYEIALNAARVENKIDTIYKSLKIFISDYNMLEIKEKDLEQLIVILIEMSIYFYNNITINLNDIYLEYVHPDKIILNLKG